MLDRMIRRCYKGIKRKRVDSSSHHEIVLCRWKQSFVGSLEVVGDNAGSKGIKVS
jgi:hypothetical protein